MGRVNASKQTNIFPRECDETGCDSSLRTRRPNPRRLAPTVNQEASVRVFFMILMTELATFCCVFQGIHQNGLRGPKPSGNLGLGTSPRLCTWDDEEKKNTFYGMGDNESYGIL